MDQGDIEDGFETARAALLKALVTSLEMSLPVGTPPRTGGGRTIWDVLADRLAVADVRSALRSIAAGPGGELTPTRAGNVAMCSAESSALMAVNFLAGFTARLGLLGRPAGALSFERELRVTGVRSRVGPTLDAVHTAAQGTVAIEAKTAEPWRHAPKVSLSTQYDEPARRTSPGTFQTLTALRDGVVRYRCLDAAQLLKHLLGIHSALLTGALAPPAKLILLYWRPSDAGVHEPLFDLLKQECEDLAERLGDQSVGIDAFSTSQLLAEWTHPGGPKWLRLLAGDLRTRYDTSLS